MPVTTIDIAKRVGIAQSTVSRVLNGSQGYRIAEETRRRVLEAASEMGYYPNVLARSLIHRRTNNIGFYWSPPSREDYFAVYAFRSAIEAGLFAGCVDTKYDLLYHSSLIGKDVERMYADIHNGKVDGLIVLSSPHDPLMMRLAASELPIVNIVDPHPTVPSVVADECGAGSMLADYLGSRGCLRAVIIESGSTMSAVERRLSAFADRCAQIGIEVVLTMRSVPLADFRQEDISDLFREANRGNLAVVCWTDSIGGQMIDILENRGGRVPHDASVVGFDGLGGLGRTVTSVRMPWMEVARRAVGLLVRRISSESILDETVVSGHEIVVGDTCI